MSYIHPEKIFGVGLRPYERVINFLSQIPVKGDTDENIDQVMSKLTKTEKKKLVKILERDRDEKKSLNDTTSHAIKTVLDIKESHPDGKIPTYRIGKEFFRHIKNLDRDIPIENIDLDNKHVYFAFDDPNFQGAYLTSELWSNDDDSKFMALRIALVPNEYDISAMKVFNFAIIEDKFNFDDLYHSKTGKELNRGADFVKEIEKSVVVFTGNYPKYKDLLVGLINSLIYIGSKDPDIEALKPKRLYTSKELKQLSPEKQKQISTIPIKLVSWSFHGRTYSKDETTVAPHMRWQPCGPNRQQVKLVWVKEHIRRYQNHGSEERPEGLLPN